MDQFRNTWINIHTHHPTGDGVEIVNVMPGKAGAAELPAMCSLGIHPWFIEKNWMNEFRRLEELVKKHEVYAIGETGLDKLSETPMELQEEVFRRHIALSETLQKPLIIHCVKAFNELVAIKKEYHPSVSWIVHGFNKNLQVADMLVRHDIYLSFGADLLKPGSGVKDVLKEMPDEVYLLETDDADIPIRDIYKAAAQMVELDDDKMKDLMYLNFINCFRI